MEQRRVYPSAFVIGEKDFAYAPARRRAMEQRRAYPSAFVIGEKDFAYAPARGGAQWNSEGRTPQRS
jgi:hypothetical protein